MTPPGDRRVAILASSAPPFAAGGIASAHHALFLLLRAAGVDCRLFTFGDWRRPGSPGVTRRGVPRLPLQLAALACSTYYRLTCGCREAYQLADVIQTAPGAFLAGRVIRRFSPHAIVAPDHGAPSLFIPKPSGARLVFVAHHGPARFRAIPSVEPGCEQDVRAALALERLALRRADAVVCPSRYMLRVFRETHRYVGPSAVIPNFVPEEPGSAPSPDDVRPGLGLPPGAPLIYVPSPATPAKGRPLLLELLQRLGREVPRPLGVYLSGAMDAQLAEALRGLPEHLRLHAPGHLSRERNLAIVRACSFAMSPTLSESFGVAILEALRLGLPVATFDVDATSELVRDGENGFLVPCGDVPRLAAAAAALTQESTLRALRGRLPKVPMEAFSRERILDGWLNVLFARGGPAAPDGARRPPS